LSGFGHVLKENSGIQPKNLLPPIFPYPFEVQIATVIFKAKYLLWLIQRFKNNVLLPVTVMIRRKGETSIAMNVRFVISRNFK
jgi:hypothetical protein